MVDDPDVSRAIHPSNVAYIFVWVQLVKSDSDGWGCTGFEELCASRREAPGCQNVMIIDVGTLL
jgi:hypothetical protein